MIMLNSGSFDCDCKDGFENFVDNVGCSDVDECDANPGPCGSGTTCLNTIGSHECECQDG